MTINKYFLPVFLTMFLFGFGNYVAAKTPPKVMIVFAHPDDETWMNGTIALFSSKGYPVDIIYTTSGNRKSSKSNKDGSKLNNYDLANYREKSLKKAIEMLSSKSSKINYEFLRFDDGRQKEYNDELSKKILQIMKRIKPNIVITFHKGGITGNSSHTYAGLATDNAFYKYKKADMLVHVVVSKTKADKFSSLTKEHKTYTIDSSTKDEMISATTDLNKIGLKKYNELRKETLSAHTTEFSKPEIELWKKFVDIYPYEEFIIVETNNKYNFKRLISK